MKHILLVSQLLLLVSPCFSLNSLLPKFTSPFQPAATSAKLSNTAIELEDKLLEAIENVEGRLANSEEINSLVLALESQKEACIPQPAIAKEVYGRWRLLYTTNAETASPIQRKAVDTSKFPIYQDIIFNTDNQLVVSQVVKFSDSAELKVDALASTSAYPLAELTERKSTGTVLGLNILGVSLVGKEAEPDPTRPDSRIDFVFDEGKFDFGSINVPYPVPFRSPLFRDWVKGWIDITWLSDRLRISRGNKGSTFILVKEEDN
ncbi:plastid-lipid-associated protein 12 [Seminavis robusta]|uniref:Plastid-lipid-associated protein 12 n=1 Tax=Seminavis robusta TaxID=568900 RepID=A0A9N8E480_9STRA|nr:plastid-lipid-associated protein 12 [Seminavis robusta]|eukprot:Sro485_g152430.1 plastid-lipid-associated protein 12 (263) ;mRNA; f:38037-38825